MKCYKSDDILKQNMYLCCKKVRPSTECRNILESECMKRSVTRADIGMRPRFSVLNTYVAKYYT